MYINVRTLTSGVGQVEQKGKLSEGCIRYDSISKAKIMHRTKDSNESKGEKRRLCV